MDTDDEPLKRYHLKAPTFPDLKTLPNGKLLEMRAEIDAILQLDLKDTNMQSEISLQLLQAKALYQEISMDALTPANQKAQVLNTITSIIASISKTSAEVYSVERLKKIESAVLACVKELDLEAKARFFDLYKDYLEQSSGTPGPDA